MNSSVKGKRKSRAKKPLRLWIGIFHDGGEGKYFKDFT
jgi:hypothetical protein